MSLVYLLPSNVIRIAAVFLSLSAPAIRAFAQHEVEFMASQTSWADSEYVGHAFMVISTRVGNGIKEDAFGFYPRGDNANAAIGGPTGVVESEFTKNPSRFSRVTESIKRPITDEQRQRLIRAVDYFNGRDYSLTDQNCIDFVDLAATLVGLKTPPRDRTDLPATFLSKLKAANEAPESNPLAGFAGTWKTNNNAFIPDGVGIGSNGFELTPSGSLSFRSWGESVTLAPKRITTYWARPIDPSPESARFDKLMREKTGEYSQPVFEIRYDRYPP